MLAALASLLLFSQLSFAGETLFLKSGAIDPSLRTFAVEKSDTHIYVLQFKSTPTRQDYANLKNLGVQRFAYVPDDAFIVEVPNIQTLKRLNWQNVRAYVPYQRTMRVGQNVQFVNVFNQNQNQLYSIRLLDKKFANAFVHEVSANKGTVVDSDGKNLIVKAQAHAVFNLASVDGVEYIEQAPEIQLDYMNFGDFPDLRANAAGNGDYSDITGYESGTKVMGFEKAWQRGYHG